ncbi:MAG TPA: tripartite tricarboxylate transporter TctB family protein [Marmoricola sp.]|nr:tripartite tricarboxylate transporter TctB family protein [Marmoricola sp.]
MDTSDTPRETSDDTHRRHPHPVNVRGELVGHEGAEELAIEDDRTTALATLVLGALLVVLGIATVTQASRLSNQGNAVGPATAPWVVGVLLLVVGALMVLRGRREHADATQGKDWHRTEPQDWQRLGVLLVALIIFGVVNPWLGYVVSATLLFGVTAIVLGAPHRAKAFAYGFVVAGTIYLLFDVLIGISLPAAVWGF